MKETEAITVQAPAKINLFLKVLGRRDDGYHDICSLVQAVNLYDTISFSKAERGIEIISDSDTLAVGSENLIWKAIELLRNVGGFSSGVRVTLSKRIPVGAGLGGGSSNAAATLKAVNRLFALNFSDRELQEFGGRLGSDVPFFFSSGTAVVSGRGEIVRDVSTDSRYHVFLVVPDFSIATADAYRELGFSLTKYPVVPTFDIEVSGAGFFESLSRLGNDFQEITVRRHPEIAHCMKTLREEGAALVTLTGSGSAFFALFYSSPDLGLQALIRSRFGWQTYDLLPTILS